MVEINWNIFKIKFNGKEQSSFEKLSYHLFCSEHNVNQGIFGFKNQAGIETEPIPTVEGLTGFQSKYYETKIGSNKKDIIDSIKKAKRGNPELNRIFFYVSQEFSESSKKGQKAPKYKIEIEESALNLKVKIIWRVLSHFERQLGLPQNQYLANYFFTQGKNEIDFLEELKNHGENILSRIQTDIIFNEQTIKIDRTSVFENLEKVLQQPKAFILSGEGGCGKTALIKDFYQLHKNKIPFYLFKAAEFNVQFISAFFVRFGMYSLKDFVDLHSEEKVKIVVIDSAERISDLENQEPFKEFLTQLLESDWTIVFTTRQNYLDDLRFQAINVFRKSLDHISLDVLTTENLRSLADDFNFELPKNERMLAIIRNLFYLREYLINYSSYQSNILYPQFQQIIWSQKIQESAIKKENIHILRENCFLEIVNARAQGGQFFVKPNDCSELALSKLLIDEIITYDPRSGGYFISHDIYEEWGLNRLIERAFINKVNNIDFLKNLGSSLIMRRSFRQWLSDKLVDNLNGIRLLIEDLFDSDSVEKFWKEEILTSILLSEYSEKFFSLYSNIFQVDNFALLRRVIFILRIACKEVDDRFANFYKESPETNLSNIYTKPKGMGWDCTIQWICQNQNSIPKHLYGNVHQLFLDWTKSKETGISTREIGLYALKLYKQVIENKELRYDSDLLEDLISLIIKSSGEIKQELVDIIENALSKGIERKDIFFALFEEIISSNYSNLPIIQAIPAQILKLADFFWYRKEDDNKHRGTAGVEIFYSLSENIRRDYFPSSAYQTPIYWLLKSSLNLTLQFILDFNNRTTLSYVNSNFDLENVIEIVLIVDDGGSKRKQFHSHSLWNMYRGMSSPITPYLLQSIHMALEKYLLEIAKSEDSQSTERLLLYLLRNSKSTSITAVVTSIVLAFPGKFFNVAKVLFSSLELIWQDNLRAKMTEPQTKNHYSIGYGLDPRKTVFYEERIKTCEDQHRLSSLEDIMVNYQFLRYLNTSEEETEKQKISIWNLIDGFHEALPERNLETDADKTKRIILARIDRRKMNPIVKKEAEHLIINFNSQLEEDLLEHSNKALEDSRFSSKYIPLNLWAMNKFDSSLVQSGNTNFDSEPLLVLSQTKEIVEKLKSEHVEYDFLLLSKSTPAFACSVLIKEYSEVLSVEDIEYCSEVIINYAFLPLKQGYRYQISDGSEVAIKALPCLLRFLPEKRTEILLNLFLILFDRHSIGEYKRICDYSVESINMELWKQSEQDALIIIGCYLKFKKVYNSELKQIEKASVKKYGYQYYNSNEVFSTFLNKHKSVIESYLSDNLILEEYDLKSYELEDLEIVFLLIPADTEHYYLLNLVEELAKIFAKKLMNRDKNLDRWIRKMVFRKFSQFILNREANTIELFVQPFSDNLSFNENTSYLFSEILLVQNTIQHYEQFWIVWESFYDKIVELSSSRDYHSNEVMHTYLFAWRFWSENLSCWHSIREREKAFFRKVVKDMGHLPSVFYSISKVLTDVGSEFLNDGIFWLKDLVIKNKNSTLEINTEYYLENIVRKYIYLNREKIKRGVYERNSVLEILNFLIERTSVNAYLLREDIL